MIDYLKIKVHGLEPEHWKSIDCLNFIAKFEYNTGRIISEEAEFAGLKFIIKGNHMIIQGSIHKYFNYVNGISAPNQQSDDIDKGFNGNRFNHENLCSAIYHLRMKFGVNPATAIIQNIEIGVNTILPFKTETVLSSLIMTMGNTFNRPKTYSYRQCEFYQYIVKIYNKGLQYGLPDEVIRFELKYTKMERINDLGIYCLQDLLKIESLYLFKNMLLKKWDSVFLIDPTIDETRLNNRDILRLAQYKNIDWWVKQKPNHLDRHKKRYKAIEKENSEHTKSKIGNLIEGEINECLKCVIHDTYSIGSPITQQYKKEQTDAYRIIELHYGLDLAS